MRVDEKIGHTTVAGGLHILNFPDTIDLRIWSSLKFIQKRTQLQKAQFVLDIGQIALKNCPFWGQNDMRKKIQKVNHRSESNGILQPLTLRRVLGYAMITRPRPNRVKLKGQPCKNCEILTDYKSRKVSFEKLNVNYIGPLVSELTLLKRCKNCKLDSTAFSIQFYCFQQHFWLLFKALQNFPVRLG